MKLIKVNVLLLALFAVTISLNAQKLYIEGGYLNPKRYGADTSEDYFDAVRVGVLYEHVLPYNFGVQTGALLNTGYAHKIQRFGIGTDKVEYSTWNYGIDIPVRGIYHQKLFWGLSMFAFAGPNIQLGIYQPQEVNASLSDIYTEILGISSGTRDLYTYKDDKGVRRINLQMGVGGGLQWRKYALKSGFDWGLNGLDRTGRDRVLQRNWYVSFVYQLK
jgi:hypothetical protein